MNVYPLHPLSPPLCYWMFYVSYVWACPVSWGQPPTHLPTLPYLIVCCVYETRGRRPEGKMYVGWEEEEEEEEEEEKRHLSVSFLPFLLTSSSLFATRPTQTKEKNRSLVLCFYSPLSLCCGGVGGWFVWLSFRTCSLAYFFCVRSFVRSRSFFFSLSLAI